MNRKSNTMSRIALCVIIMVMLFSTVRAYSYDVFNSAYYAAEIQIKIMFGISIDNGDPDEPIKPPDEPPPANDTDPIKPPDEPPPAVKM